MTSPGTEPARPALRGRQADSARRRARVIQAISAAAGQEISPSSIARAAGVDRTFLYRHRDLLEQVHAVQANATAPAGTGPAASWITPSLVETRFSPDALVWVTVVFHGTAAWRNHGLIIFPLLFYRTSVQLRCPAAPPGGGLRPPGRPPGLGHLLVGHPGFALRVPRAGRG